MKINRACLLISLSFLTSVMLPVIRFGIASAATLEVNSVGDSVDINPGDGFCDDGTGNCTLRAAIDEANASVGADTINFNISGSGVHTITPVTQLPDITDDVTIDGSTQPGSNCGTLVPTNFPASSNSPHTLKIEIDANSVSKGFVTYANTTIIRGFVIRGASNTQIDGGGNSLKIECNYIGTDVNGSSSGQVTLPTGITSNSNNGIIQNNLISGNNVGVNVNSSETVRDNLIGTNATGLSALANHSNGVLDNSGYGTVINHNIIAGNEYSGLYLNGANSVAVKGNMVGVNLKGSPLGNGKDGIEVFSSSDFVIGGTTIGDGNVVSANLNNGIHIYSNCSGSGVSSGGSIFGNYIGARPDASLSTGYGNGMAGIEVNEFQSSCGSVYKHQIGGDNKGQPNVIAGNVKQGILVHQDQNHDVFSIVILSNSIYGNGGLGIDLAADYDSNSGIADLDLGPNPINNLPITYPTTYGNYYLNRPVVNSSSFSDNKLTINYSFSANTVQDSGDINLHPSDLVGYRLDFYLNDKQTDGAYSGYAQGQEHIGSFIVDGAAINAEHTFTSVLNPGYGKYITATATVLWKKIPDDQNTNCHDRVGNGPPYYESTNGCPN